MKGRYGWILGVLLTLISQAVTADPPMRVLGFQYEVTQEGVTFWIEVSGKGKPELIERGAGELLVWFPNATCVPRSMILFNSSLVRRARLEQHSHTSPTVHLVLGLLRPVVGKLIPHQGKLELQVRPRHPSASTSVSQTSSRTGKTTPIARQPKSSTPVADKGAPPSKPFSPGSVSRRKAAGSAAPKTPPRKLPEKSLAPKGLLSASEDGSPIGRPRTSGSQAEHSSGTIPRGSPRVQTAQALFPEPLINVEMQDTDLRQLLRGLAKQDDIKLIIHDSVKGRVSVSLHGVTPLQAIQQILTANGYIYEQAGEYLIAAAPEVMTRLVPMEWKVIPLQHAQASELQGVLEGLVSAQGSVQADTRTNSLVLRDTPSNLERYEQLVRSLDVPLEASERPTQTEIFFFKRTDLEGMTTLVKNLLTADGRVTANTQANALVVTDTPENLRKIRTLTQQFEEARDAGQTLVTRVFRLKYVDANAIRSNLEALLSPDGKLSTFVRQETLLQPIRQKANAGPYKEGGVAATNDSEERREIKKWSDTLIVTDRPEIVAQIETLIQELDTLGTQVVIEAQILELGMNAIQQLGIQWQATHDPSDTFFSSGPYQQVEGVQALFSTLSAGAFRQITAAIQALESRGQAKLLAHPRTTTLDNELAQLLVTDRIPIPTLRETQFASTTTYEYLDVGIILTVVPHISGEGDILMEVSAQVDSLKGEPKQEGVPPVISSRVAHSRVRVTSGQTLAIGGLTKEEILEKTSGVPVLSRLPILGALFRSKEKVERKTDLLILLTPKILRGEETETHAAF